MSYTKDWNKDKKIEFVNEAFDYLSDGPLGAGGEIDFIIFLQLQDTVYELLELLPQEEKHN